MLLTNRILMKIAWLLALALLISPVLRAQSQKSDKPNVVIIISDDHAFQAIGAYGSTLMKTPGIDRIAREGAVLNRAYVTSSIRGPSRAVLLAGKYTHMNGLNDNEPSHFNLGQDLFVKRMQQGGYQTAWIGKQHLGDKPEGFDYWEILPGQGNYFNPDFIRMDGSRVRYEGYVSNVVTDLAESW